MKEAIVELEEEDAEGEEEDGLNINLQGMSYSC